MSASSAPVPEPIFTRRLRHGVGLLAAGLGLMFLAGKVLLPPVPAGIATGIALGVVGFVVIVVEALRESPEPGDGDHPRGGALGPPPPPPRRAKHSRQ